MKFSELKLDTDYYQDRATKWATNEWSAAGHRVRLVDLQRYTWSGRALASKSGGYVQVEFLDRKGFQQKTSYVTLTSIRGPWVETKAQVDAYVAQAQAARERAGKTRDARKTEAITLAAALNAAGVSAYVDYSRVGVPSVFFTNSVLAMEWLKTVAGIAVRETETDARLSREARTGTDPDWADRLSNGAYRRGE